MDGTEGFEDLVHGGIEGIGFAEAGEPEGADGAVASLEFAEDIGIEGDDGDLVRLEAGGADFLEEGGDDFRAAFDLDIEFLSVRDGGGDFGEGWDAGVGELRGLPAADVELAELFEGAVLGNEFGAGGALGVGVVKADDFAVAGEVEIALDGIGVLIPSELEGRQGVFRGIVRGTTVGDDEGLCGEGGEEEEEREGFDGVHGEMDVRKRKEGAATRAAAP